MVWKLWPANRKNRESDTSAHAPTEAKHDLWVWVRVPLSALERAITALKDRAIAGHMLKSRLDAAKDDAAAEDIKRSLRKDHDDESKF
jgi:hypothetical protein